MNSESSRATYVIQEPYEKALARLRRELEDEGLKIPSEMDVSGTIREKLGLDLWPCRVLHVCCPFSLLWAAVRDPAETAFLPVRIVVSGRDQETVVRLANFADSQKDGRDKKSVVLASLLLARVQTIVEKIGAPQFI